MSGTPVTEDRTRAPLSATRSRSGGPRAPMQQGPPPPSIAPQQREMPLVGALEVDYGQLEPDPDQPRKTMSEERLRELAASIRRHGVLQPLVVRLGRQMPDGGARYIVVAGGRRLRAIGLAVEEAALPEERARLARVPVILSATPESERRVVQLLENLQREALPPVEEARAITEIMQVERLSLREMAGRLSISKSEVERKLLILQHHEVEEAVERGLIARTVGAEIAQLQDAAVQRELLDRIQSGERVRVKDVRELKRPQRLVSVDDVRRAATGEVDAARSVAEGGIDGKAVGDPSVPLTGQSMAQEDQDTAAPGFLSGGKYPPEDRLPGSADFPIPEELPVAEAEELRHPAVAQAVAHAYGERIRLHLPAEFRAQVDETLTRLAAGSDPALWLPALYRGLIGDRRDPESGNRTEE